MSAHEFTVEIFQNEYLPAGAREVNAVVTVTAAGRMGYTATAASAAAEVIIVDCSGSMSTPMAKINQARRATAAAVDAIRDGVAFAVVAGTHEARQVYPTSGLIPADMATRKAAQSALKWLAPVGGTAIGQWLRLAREIFETGDETLRHVILLTDGRNEHESAEQLAEAISQCEGYFSCDCRGVGTDWNVDELRKISTALLGTVDIVPDAAGLAADFEAMMTASMAKEMADVKLRVWTPNHTAVRFVKQVAPTVGDLTTRRTQVNAQVGDYPTGAWGAGESRDYHICVEVEPATIGQEMRAARVSLIQESEPGPKNLGEGLVRAIWTDDEGMSTRINRHVAHYTGQAELAQAIQDGLEARKAGDDNTAAARLGRAVALAHESGNEGSARLLASVVDVIDPVTGTIRLKKNVIDADEMALDTRSSKTVRVRK